MAAREVPRRNAGELVTRQDLHVAVVLAFVAFAATLIERYLRRQRGLPL